MKNIRFIIILAYLCFGANVRAQDMYRPFINKVSVHPETGKITITWDMPVWQNPPQNVDEFVLHWYATVPSPSYIPFDTVMVGQRSYEFDYDDKKIKYPDMPDPRKTSVGFSVTAVQKTPYETTLQSVPHYNVQVSNAYDSCKSEIKLDWYRYQGWTSNTPPNKPLDGYTLIRIPAGGGAEEIVKTLTANDTTYTVHNVEDKDIYVYYIEARRDGETSTSYATTRTTNMPVSPAFISAESVQYNSEGLAEISFKLDPLSETHSYQFLGSSRPEYAFVPLGTFDIYGDTVLTDIQSRGKTYYYRLEAWHVCKNKVTATSNTATAMWLMLKQEGSVSLLHWEPYTDWGEDALYKIYRKIGDADSVLIADVLDPDKIVFDDDLKDVFIDGNVCYWIVAAPISNSFGKIAISNRICITPESNVWIPQAFTPNVAGVNGEFKPFFSYPPKEYMLYLYDLNGAKVFETKDFEAGWNGYLLNGKPAGEGVYVYYLKFRTELGRLVEKKGTFGLILP